MYLNRGMVILVIMEKLERLLRVSEVAKILNVERHTVLNWIKKGKLRAIRLPGGRFRIPESEVKRIVSG